MSIINSILTRIQKRNSIKYAKNLGVAIGENFRLTGNPGWGSEPWLIQIGNHVLLSSEIRFITHDAGTFLFRDTEKYKDVFKFATIVIQDNCFSSYLEMRSMILPGGRDWPERYCCGG